MGIFNPTIEEEEKTIKSLKSAVKNQRSINGEPVYAIPYAWIEKDGTKRLLHSSPIIFNKEKFEQYCIEHEQYGFKVLAVFNEEAK